MSFLILFLNDYKTMHFEVGNKDSLVKSIINVLINDGYFVNYNDSLIVGQKAEVINNFNFKNLIFPIPKIMDAGFFSFFFWSLGASAVFFIKENPIEYISLYYFVSGLTMSIDEKFRIVEVEILLNKAVNGYDVSVNFKYKLFDESRNLIEEGFLEDEEVYRDFFSRLKI